VGALVIVLLELIYHFGHTGTSTVSSFAGQLAKNKAVHEEELLVIAGKGGYFF
jgi:hypothetical protein